MGLRIGAWPLYCYRRSFSGLTQGSRGCVHRAAALPGMCAQALLPEHSTCTSLNNPSPPGSCPRLSLEGQDFFVVESNRAVSVNNYYLAQFFRLITIFDSRSQACPRLFVVEHVPGVVGMGDRPAALIGKG